MKWGQAWSIDESLIRVRVKFFLQTMAYNPLGPLLNALLTYSCVNTYSCSNFEKWNVTLILICKSFSFKGRQNCNYETHQPIFENHIFKPESHHLIFYNNTVVIVCITSKVNIFKLPSSYDQGIFSKGPEVPGNLE